MFNDLGLCEWELSFGGGLSAEIALLSLNSSNL